jgi:hypothetical protein
MKSRYIFVIFLLIGFNGILSKSFRVNQIPNGSINSCSNCHTSQFGGGLRTNFGNDILSNYLDNTGNVIWGSQLAQIDSDGDGYTNGWELGDPNGSWVIGNNNPGDQQFVTNPGDINSLEVHYANNIESTFKLHQNHPNPFNPTTEIEYFLPEDLYITITVYDLKGNKVSSLYSGNNNMGNYRVVWNGKNDIGQSVPGGIYLYKLEAETFSQTKKMILLK